MYIHTLITAENLPNVAHSAQLKGLDVFDTTAGILYRFRIALVHVNRRLSPVTLEIRCTQGVFSTIYAGQSAIDFWINLIPVVQEPNEDTAKAMSAIAEEGVQAHKAYQQRSFQVSTGRSPVPVAAIDGTGAIF